MTGRPADTLRSQFTKGVFWTTADTYGSAGLSFIFTVWLARILTSSDFGLSAAASVVTMFFMVLMETAMSTVVQHKHASRAQLSSVFWCSQAALLGVYLLIAAAASFFARIAHVPELAAILRVASLQLPVLGLLIVPLALLRTQLRFRELAFTQITATLVSGVFAVVLAMRGYGYWALIIQGVLLIVVRAALVWRLSRFLPMARLRLADIRPLARYTGGLAGFSTVNYWSRNVDIVLVGRFFGAQPLGYYSLAFRLIGMPVQLVSGALRPLLHPTLVAMDRDEARMRRAYIHLVRSTALVTFPIAALLWAGAQPIVSIVWGPGWEPVAGILRALAPLAAVQPVNSLSASVYMATDATGLLFRLSVANAVIIIAGMLVGLPFGVVGIAWANSIVYVLIVAPLSSGLAAHSLLHARTRDVLAALVPGIAVAAVVLGLALLAGNALT